MVWLLHRLPAFSLPMAALVESTKAGSPLSTHRALKPPSAGKRASSAKNILAPVRRVAAFSAILRHKSLAPDWVRPWVNVSWTVSAQIPSGAGSSDNHSGSAPTRSGAAHTGGPPSSSSWTSRCPLATAIPAPPPSIRPVAPRTRRAVVSDRAGPAKAGVHPVHHLGDEAGQIAIRQPLAEATGQRRLLVGIVGEVGLAQQPLRSANTSPIIPPTQG